MKLADAVKVVRTVRIRHVKIFTQHVVPEVVRPARVIWNQAVGGVFLLFAVLFFANALRYYKDIHADSHNGLALVLSLFLGLVMAFFGLGSFLKARRISRM